MTSTPRARNTAVLIEYCKNQHLTVSQMIKVILSIKISQVFPQEVFSVRIDSTVSWGFEKKNVKLSLPNSNSEMMEKLIAWQWQLLTGFNIVLCCCVAYVIIARGITTMDLLHVRKLCFSCDLFLSYFKIHNAISVTRPNTWTRKISQFVFTALSPYCLVDLSLLLPICYWLYACHNSQC